MKLITILVSLTLMALCAQAEDFAQTCTKDFNEFGFSSHCTCPEGEVYNQKSGQCNEIETNTADKVEVKVIKKALSVIKKGLSECESKKSECKKVASDLAESLVKRITDNMTSEQSAVLTTDSQKSEFLMSYESWEKSIDKYCKVVEDVKISKEINPTADKAISINSDCKYKLSTGKINSIVDSILR